MSTTGSANKINKEFKFSKSKHTSKKNEINFSNPMTNENRENKRIRIRNNSKNFSKLEHSEANSCKKSEKVFWFQPNAKIF